MYYTKLDLDAMYLHAAKRCLSSASIRPPLIQQAKDRFQELVADEAHLLANARSADLDSDQDGNGVPDETVQQCEADLERVYIAMESADYMIGQAYGPFLQELATVHLFCAASLEAHVNAIAKDRLTGRLFGEFDKLALAGKWLFLPHMLGLPSLDPGSEPFQSFDKLVTYRNLLTHYKTKREEWRYGEVPGFLIPLGLTLQAATRSVEVVGEMVKSLANHMDQDVPYWIKIDDVSYFTFEIDRTAGNVVRNRQTEVGPVTQRGNLVITSADLDKATSIHRPTK